ncbi:lipocalin family protein [uncultured Roseobacter sp.]|uniref:lipocalin family protein n=1 Tax=uncultured Roseobacter sp. TaxID=114847 RepID=UPI002635D132|nr:lipocalin family protein [uncultured Roseobacter sp.]
MSDQGRSNVGFAVGIASVLRRYDVGAPRALRWGFLYAGLALLLACAPPPQSFRDGAVPITASTRFTPEAIAGDWHVIAAYASPLWPGCADQLWQIDSAATEARLMVRCGGRVRLDAPLEVDARGVMQVRSGALDRPARALWVMWLAEDRRTAVIGTPGGEMGWIVNRAPRLAPDRATAARAIMAFNGYDIARLPGAEPGS